jgi:hypothetical protein
VNRTGRFILLVLFTAAATFAAPGCWLWKKKRPQSDPIPPSTQYSQEFAVRTQIEDRPVKTGSLPMAYLLEFPGEIRVVDASAGRVILATRAGGRTIVSLDAEKGVTVGGRNVVNQRLDPTHVYEIYLTPSGESVNRNIYERR